MSARPVCSTRAIPKSSKNGMDITQPFYWNIAPNYDATITSRFMDRRGLMEQVEFRYMPDPAHWQPLLREPGGRQAVRRDGQPQSHLSTVTVTCSTPATSMFMDNAMQVSVDYTQGTGPGLQLLQRLHPKVGTQVDNQLQQSLKAGYYQQNWNLDAEVRTYQILLASAQQPTS